VCWQVFGSSGAGQPGSGGGDYRCMSQQIVRLRKGLSLTLLVLHDLTVRRHCRAAG
jgi:hypothetical protein